MMRVLSQGVLWALALGPSEVRGEELLPTVMTGPKGRRKQMRWHKRDGCYVPLPLDDAPLSHQTIIACDREVAFRLPEQVWGTLGISGTQPNGHPFNTSFDIHHRFDIMQKNPLAPITQGFMSFPRSKTGEGAGASFDTWTVDLTFRRKGTETAVPAARLTVIVPVQELDEVRIGDGIGSLKLVPKPPKHVATKPFNPTIHANGSDAADLKAGVFRVVHGVEPGWLLLVVRRISLVGGSSTMVVPFYIDKYPRRPPIKLYGPKAYVSFFELQWSDSRGYRIVADYDTETVDPNGLV